MTSEIRPQIEFKHLPHFVGRRALVVAPHCDDETIGCGGTIIKSAKAGCHVEILFVAVSTSSDQAHYKVRRAEAESACSLLGVGNLRFLNHCIRRIDAKALALDLANQIAIVKPQTIVLPWFGDNHIDHWAVNDALVGGWTNAGRPVATVLAYEVWTPSPADTLVNVSLEMPLKLKALREYRSQLRLWRYEPMVAALNCFRAHSRIPPHFRRIRYAEGFLQREIAEYIDLVDLRRREMSVHAGQSREIRPEESGK
jgi:LmbE family N-acetylglucosaminyl deacetylase